MIERSARQSVTFPWPFFVDGLDRDQPAGTYDVEVVEELIEGLSFLAYRVVSASLVLPLTGYGSGSSQLVRIAPSLVRAAEAAGKGDASARSEQDAAKQS
jgi:hypothetical protein